MKNAKEYTAADLIQLIRNKYKVDTIANGNHPAVLLEQVADATGFATGRWVDAVVFEMWESEGRTRRAFELKISRSDFLRELKHPDKYQWCLNSFHEFWYVAPKDAIKIEELPQGVGWFYPAGNRLITGRQASYNHKPELNDKLLASFIRSADKEIINATKRDKIQFLAEDEDYQRAILYKKAVTRFLAQRYANPFEATDATSEDVIIKTLESATVAKQLKGDIDYLKDIADTFQQDLADLFNFFAVIASKSILAQDDMGKRIVERWGKQEPIDKNSLKNLRKDDYAKRYIQIIENIRQWEKLK